MIPVAYYGRLMAIEVAQLVTFSPQIVAGRNTSHDPNRGNASHDPNRGNASHDPNRGNASHDSNRGNASHDPNRGSCVLVQPGSDFTPRCLP